LSRPVVEPDVHFALMGLAMTTTASELTGNMTSTIAPPTDDPIPIWVGYVAVVVSVIFFGSNFVPAAKYPIGDGLSFQFFLCCGIWVTGAVINVILNNPPFYSLVLIGGALWTTGNVLSVFVISINGLGLSMLLWCTSNLFMGKSFASPDRSRRDTCVE
jgi:hypothetical protein